MNAFGVQPLWVHGRETAAACYRPDRSVRHELLADGGVRIIMPRSGEITDAQARRLAWALLADLAPDEIVPAADVVTYKEAQRLAVLRAVAAGARTGGEIAAALDWSVRTALRRAAELAGDGRLAADRLRLGGGPIRYSLQLDETGA